MADAVSDPLDPEMAEALAMEAERNRGLPPSSGIVEDRARGIAAAPFWAEGAPAVGEIESHRTSGPAGEIELRLYRPQNAPSGPLPVVLYVHGGGWAQGSIAQNEPCIRGLVAESGWAVLATTYRLAPEHPYPAGLEDCLAAADWLRQEGPALGLDPGRMALSGTSAGANLALAAGLALRDRGTPPAALVLFYGVYGADFDTDSYRAFGDGRYGLPRAQMERYFTWYDPDGRCDRDPLIQPLLDGLHGLPPCWLVAAGLDVLRDDTILLHRRLLAAGNRVTFRYEPGVTHGFINRGRMVGAARRSLAAAASFLQERASAS